MAYDIVSSSDTFVIFASEIMSKCDVLESPAKNDP